MMSATTNTTNKGIVVNKKRAIGYIRVSTAEQAEPEKYGLDAQRAAITEYADKNGYQIIDWRQDVGSGVDSERPGLNEILYGDCFNPPVEAVIVFKSDRVARDTKLYFYCLFLLEKKRISLISVEEDFPEGTEFANIYRSMIMFAAEMERKNITLRTSRGRAQKSAVGGYAGGRVPYGYKVVDHCLVVNEAEAELVRRVYQLRAEGVKPNPIAAKLADEGYRGRKGSLLERASVVSILKGRPLYEGWYKYGKDSVWIPGLHEPILERTMTDPNAEFDENNY